jgi:hypothetical protein
MLWKFKSRNDETELSLAAGPVYVLEFWLKLEGGGVMKPGQTFELLPYTIVARNI